MIPILKKSIWIDLKWNESVNDAVNRLYML